MKICMNANIINVTFMFWKSFVILFTLSQDLITTLTYVLMVNFCPCFIKIKLCLITKNISAAQMYKNFHDKDSNNPYQNCFNLDMLGITGWERSGTQSRTTLWPTTSSPTRSSKTPPTSTSLSSMGKQLSGIRNIYKVQTAFKSLSEIKNVIIIVFLI